MIRLLTTILLGYSSLISPCAKAQWQLHDVSILLPLPSTHQQAAAMVHVRSEGESGPLLPEKYQMRLQNLVLNMEKNRVYEELLKVVAIRVDPCFFEGVGPLNCKRQIRMVWQPVTSIDSDFTTMDAALHTFYELNEDEWILFMRQYMEFLNSHREIDVGRIRPHHDSFGRNPKQSTVLGIHPVIKREGLKGPYWSKLRSLLLMFCGEQNLSRVTLMSLDPDENQWVFIGFNVERGALKGIEIPEINGKAQAVTMRLGESLEYQATVVPFAHNETFLKYFSDSAAAVTSNPIATTFHFINEFAKMENPSLHNPGTVDCASCHLAMGVMDWGRRNFSELNHLKPRNFGVSYGKSKTNHLRAFGYFDSEPVVALRTVNESVEVINWLNSN